MHNPDGLIINETSEILVKALEDQGYHVELFDCRSLKLARILVDGKPSGVSDANIDNAIKRVAGILD